MAEQPKCPKCGYGYETRGKGVASRFKETQVRRNTGAVIRDVDRRVIDEALTLADQGIGVAFFLRDREWTIGREEYRDLIGFGHLHELLNHPGSQIHVYAMTRQANLENARKAVQKSINRAISTLANQPDIRLHIEKHIKTGTHCTYTGDWVWQFAP